MDNYYYEWISEKTGERHKHAAAPRQPATNPYRFLNDWENWCLPTTDYNGEPVFLMNGERFVEQLT